MSNVNRRFREARRRLGLKQGELADRLGVTQGTVSRWETGLSRPDTSALFKLAEMVGEDPLKFALNDEDHSYIREHWGKFFEVIGSIQEDEWLEAPEWDEDQRFQVQIPTLPTWEGLVVEGFVVQDDSCEPYYTKGSVVFAARPPGGSVWLHHEDYVVVVRNDDRGLFEVTVRECYINSKGETYFTSISPDPSIGQSFKLLDELASNSGFIEMIPKISLDQVRGVIIASFKIENPRPYVKPPKIA